MTVRVANLLGASALAVADSMRDVAEGTSLQAGAGPGALVAIDTHPGQSIDTLARVLGLTGSGAVRLVDRLSADGLVERRAGSDGRTRALHLSRTGKQTVRRMLDRRESALLDALSTLSADEQAQLMPMLEKLLQRLAPDRVRARGICRLCDVAACRAGARCPLDLDVVDLPLAGLSP